MDLKVFQFYTKFTLFLGITIFLSITTSVVLGQSDFDLVEIKLIDNLDDKRGFCIDIKGYKSRANIERGLQAHTCYSYQGEIAIDQGLDANKLKTCTPVCISRVYIWPKERPTTFLTLPFLYSVVDWIGISFQCCQVI